MNKNNAREYKQQHVFNINGVNYAQVIAARTYDLGIKNFFRELARLIAFDYFIDFSPGKSSVLSVYSYRGKGRADYDGTVDGFRSFIDVDCGRLECTYKIRFRYLFIKIFNFIKYSVIFASHKVNKSIFAACLVAQFKHYPAIFARILDFSDYQLVVTFCDAHGIENLITQLANKHCQTATLQHGQYRVLKPETENADIEAYENFISNYLFAWGKVTQDEFMKAGIKKSRIISVGAIKPFSNNVRSPFHERRYIFGVVLDGEVYKDSNFAIIKLANDLAKNTNMKYILRLHPKNNPNDYLPYCEKEFLSEVLIRVENQEYADRVDFSLVHMTGVFVELLSINSPMFLYNDKYLEEIFKIENAVFSDNSELQELYVRFNSDTKSFLDTQYALYRDFNEGGDLRANYNAAIKAILEEAHT